MSFLRRFRSNYKWFLFSLLFALYLWARESPLSIDCPPYIYKFHSDQQLKLPVVKKYLENCSDKVVALKNLLDSLGFFSPSFDTVRDTIFIHAGDQNIIDSLRILSPIPCTIDSIQKGLFPRIYNAGELALLAEKTVRFFGSKGYPFVELSISILNAGSDVHPAFPKKGESLNGCIVEFFIRVNGRYCFSRPLLSGNWTTNSRLIEHDIFIKKDSIFDLRKIEESKSHLLSRHYINSAETGQLRIINEHERVQNASGFSGNVQVPFVITDNTGLGIDGAIAFTAGAPGANNLSGVFNISLLNLFHYGEIGQLTYRGEQDYQRLEVSLEMPFLFNIPLFGSTGFGLEIRENDYGYLHGEIKMTTDIVPFWQWGLILKGHEVSDSGGYSSRFEGIDFVVSKDTKPYRAGELAGEADLKIGSGIVQLNGRQLNRWHIDGDFGIHYPFNYRHALLGRIVFGTLLVDTKDTLRTVELYRTGGYNSVRGYSDNEFAFRSVFYEQLEYHVYFNYRGSVFIFIDSGIGSKRDEPLKMSFVEKLLGYGLGIRIPVKIGNASIEWARNYLETSGWGRLHFAISNTLAASHR
jgi:outer membrane protein assembly factor BamA